MLFIDADLRRGYSHNLFTVSNEHGLSEYLAGKDELNKVIQHFGKGGFDVITRGQVPPNPSELLMRDRMRQLLEWANDHYDLVIVDTPPMLAVSDAAVVGRSVGTSLLVARFGLNTAKEVSLSMQRLEQAGVNIKGAILNGVIKRASTAYSYGYNYYGYSYSERVKLKVAGCGVNAFSGLRIRQFFVCHQPQSIQVTECSFLITNCTPVCVLHSRFA